MPVPIRSNPIGGPGKSKFHRRGSLREFDMYENPAGDFYTRSTGHFNPTDPSWVHGRLPKLSLINPARLKKYIKPEEGEGRTIGRFFVGLTRGVGDLAGEEIPVEAVVDFVADVRRQQLPKKLRGGATFITQKGFFTDWKSHKEHPDEDSVQIVVYPEFDGGETLAKFDKNMRALARMLTEEFDQRAVVLDLEINGKLKFLGEAKQ